MERSLKIFFACVFGAAIGTFVALEIYFPFWWIGLLVGAVLSYLAYDFKKVVRAVPKAYKMARAGGKSVGNSVISVPWKILAIFLASILVVLLTWLPLYLFTIVIDAWVFFQFVMAIPLVLVVVVPLLFLFIEALEGFQGLREEWVLKDLLSLMKTVNPFIVYFYYLPKGIFFLLKKLPYAISEIFYLLKAFFKKTGEIVMKVLQGGFVVLGWILVFFISMVMLLGRFGKAFFFLLHKEDNAFLLCAFMGALGVGIGYFAGSVIVGGLAGGFAGLFEHEIVSKRVLKLAPR